MVTAPLSRVLTCDKRSGDMGVTIYSICFLWSMARTRPGIQILLNMHIRNCFLWSMAKKCLRAKKDWWF